MTTSSVQPPGERLLPARPGWPDATGHFGIFGGRFVPEALIAALDELTEAYEAMRVDPAFLAEFDRLQRDYTGRPSPITEVQRFAEHAGGARILLKREDLNHTGSHKINNVLGQALLTKRIGKTRVIAETGAGQHGVATATAAALMGLSCTVYMGEEDTRRQALNVARMRLLGAEVIPVTTGSRTLKDAINEAFRDWVTNVETTNYVLRHRRRARTRSRRWSATSSGSSATRRASRCSSGRAGCPTPSWPASAAAPTRSASSPRSCRTTACGWSASRPAATASTPAGTRRPSPAATPGVLHGARSYLLQDDNGQTIESHSISAGLDYPGRRAGALLPARHRPRRVPGGDRRRGDGGLRAAVPHRGHHPGDRVGARPGRRDGRSARSSAPVGRVRCCWSTCPAAATRTSRPRRRGSVSATARRSTPVPGSTPTSSPPRARSARRRRRGPGRRRRRHEPTGRAHRQGEGGEPGRADRLPPGRLPRRRRLDRRDDRGRRGRGRHRRGRRALQRPGHGRAGDPAGGRRRRPRGRRHARRAARRRRRWPPPGPSRS